MLSTECTSGKNNTNGDKRAKSIIWATTSNSFSIGCGLGVPPSYAIGGKFDYLQLPNKVGDFKDRRISLQKKGCETFG